MEIKRIRELVRNTRFDHREEYVMMCAGQWSIEVGAIVIDGGVHVSGPTLWILHGEAASKY